MLSLSAPSIRALLDLLSATTSMQPAELSIERVPEPVHEVVHLIDRRVSDLAKASPAGGRPTCATGPEGQP